jgi:hypothetical protein
VGISYHCLKFSKGRHYHATRSARLIKEELKRRYVH